MLLVRRVLLFIAVALSLAAVIGISWIVRSGGDEPSTPRLAWASSESLAQVGIVLSAPDGRARVDGVSAVDRVTQEFPGASIREIVLAQVDDTHAVPERHCLCWVASIVPAGGLSFPSSGPPGASRTVAVPSYMIVLFDANSGAFVEGAASSE